MSQEHEVPGELDDTDSYDLARVDSPEETPAGPVQRYSPSERRPLDVAYKSSSRTVDEDIVEGISNEDIWMLIRRFNKQIYYVKAVPDAPPKGLDLNRAEDEQYPPEKLRMTLERFYMTVVVGLSGFFNHIARLRSWKEPIRTSIFCAIYFLSWYHDVLALVTTGILIALILRPSVRTWLFPAPAPKPIPGSDDANNSPVGDASQDSITHVPERYKGEAAEQEARNLVNSVANVAMESAAAKYGQGVSTEDPDTATEAFTEEVVAQAVDDAAPDGATPQDKTKKPMKKKVATATDHVMRVISDITDIYEKFANVFSPTPPFYLVTPRLRFVGALAGIAASSLIVSSHFIIRTVSFAAGLGFFGGPIFSWTMTMLNERVPDWKKHLDLRQTLLHGVPTNAQLTLTLLRIGELNSSPLPPPPTSLDDDQPSWPIKTKKKNKTKLAIDNKPANSTDSLTSPSQETLTSTTTSNSTDPTKPPKKSKRRFISKVLRFVRRTIATAIKGHIAFDRAMAIAGSAQTKSLISLLSNRGWISAPLGPLKFDCKFERKRGAVVIDSSLEPPVLYFTTYQSEKLDDLRLESRKKGSVLFQIPVTEIVELKKTEGLGWKGKLIVELTAGSKEAADGLIITGGVTDEGEERSYHVTGMRGRNQLFNRLVAIGAQFWESR